MNNWIVVKLCIKQIINFNHENFHIAYDEENEYRKISDLIRVKNRSE
jgi:hypothetical protein